MSELPQHPDVEQARRRAKELLRAAQAGDAESLAQLSAVAAPLTLAGAQLALARQFGQPSWAALVREIEARNASIPEHVVQFLRSSVNLGIGQAARMLFEDPSLAQSGFPAAVVLGDATLVASELRRDPGAATRIDLLTGWSALHLACASRFHLDESRAPGLIEVTRLLLDAGAELDAESRGRRCWRPLECAVTSANSSPNNAPLIQLLLDRGAPVRPETLVASLYAAGGTWCLAMLLEHASGGPELLTDALASAVADANQDALAVLLAAGADPDLPGPDGRSARRRALTAGVTATVELLGGPGETATDQLLGALLSGDSTAARRLVAVDPGLAARLDAADRAALVTAAEHGNAASVALMLELGFPIGTRCEGEDEDGRTALHAAAFAGAADVVAVLLANGADLTARDTRWNGRPLEWALEGSGDQPQLTPAPDWRATVTLLLDAGAPTDGLNLGDGDAQQQPSTEVFELLRARLLL